MPFYLILLFILSFIGCYCFKIYALKNDSFDHPNHRSLHTTPTPRGGGLVFIFLWLLFSFVFTYLHPSLFKESLALLPPVFVISLISFMDDKINLSSKWRFLIHLLAALYFLIFTIAGAGNFAIDLGLFTLNFFVLTFIFAFFFLIWSTNLFNFMDGSDGLAASEAIFILSVAGYILQKFQAMELAYLCFAMVAMLFGFLIWNWPRAKIFMGDVGSASLGFLIAAMALLAQKFYGMPLYLWLMLYGVFLFDATITLIRRILKRERWREAHRSHAFQRLALSGWSHRRVLLSKCLLNLGILVLVAMAIAWQHYCGIFILIEVIVLAYIYYRIEKICAM